MSGKGEDADGRNSGGGGGDYFYYRKSPNNGTSQESPVKLNEIFQLEEITHFQRINDKLAGSSKLVPAQRVNNEGDNNGTSKGGRIVDSGDSFTAGSKGDQQPGNVLARPSSASFSPLNPFIFAKSHECESDEEDASNRSLQGSTNSSDDEESDCDVFNRAENYTGDVLVDAQPGTSGSGGRKNNVSSAQGKTAAAVVTGEGKDGFFRDTSGGTQGGEVPPWRADHSSQQMTFHPLNDSFVLDVKRADVILDAIVFLTILGEFLTNVTIAIWHYQDGMRLSCGITLFFILLGAWTTLHQFNILEEREIKRIFSRGKRIRILVNCFTPLATLLSSLRCLQLGYKATGDPMISSQYLEVENFSKSLYKTQSVFQSAPLATVQLVILVEALDEGSIGLLKGFVSLTNIVLCWSVMTNANLPSKVEDYDHVKKVSGSPSRRLYIGIRMFSSFASRTMAVTSLLISSRCLLSPSSNSVRAGFVGIAIMVLPRVIFFFIDFIRQRTVARRRIEDVEQLRSNNGRYVGATTGSATRGGDGGDGRRMSCCETFMGYMATILFPVGHPVWLFWYIWGETALCVIIGNILGWSKGCLSNTVDAVYTGVFLVLFIIIPIIVPVARNTVRQRRRRKAENFFHNGNARSSSSGSSRNSNAKHPPTSSDPSGSSSNSGGDAHTVADTETILSP